MNPIIPGFAPDPSIVLVDDTYYLVNSSFHIFPGLPVYASKDLVSWRHITNAFNRRSQLSLAYSDTTHSPSDEWGEVMSATGGLYAPTIRHHNGTFFVICTNIIRGNDDKTESRHQNFIITTTDITSHNWSDPVFFDFDGIDTSLVWDDDGHAYLHGSAAPGPMTTIRMFEIDLSTGKKLTEEKLLWRGTGGIWPEGPHLYRKDGWWYLMISEGGTFDNHMITVARSRDIWGPYESNPANPILTARGTGEYVQNTGHCDMFCDKEGKWWCVCLGVRKDASKRYILGRETFLTPGDWPQGEWPTLKPVKIDFAAAYHKGDMSKPSAPLTAEPNVDFCYIRDADLSKYAISPDGTTIELTASKADLCDARSGISFVGKRQRVLAGRSSVVLLPSPSPSKASPGLAVYKDEHRYARVFLSPSEPAEMVLEVVNTSKNIRRSVRKPCGPPSESIELSVSYTEANYTFAFTTTAGKSTATTAFEAFDTLELVGPDFTGPVVGVFLTGGGSEDSGERNVFRDLKVE